MNEDASQQNDVRHELRAESEPGLVSVIIPTYNRAELLGPAMDSVAAQTYRPIELVVADDGSTDDTPALVQRWAERHASPDLRVLYLPIPHSGATPARNLGIVRSHGQYIQSLDSDDYLHPDRFSILVEAAAAVPGFQVAATRYVFVDGAGRATAWADPPDLSSEDRLELCLKRSLWTGSPFIARSFLAEAGLTAPDILMGDDWEQGVRFALRCRPERCLIVRRTLAYYREHEGPRIMTTSIEPQTFCYSYDAVREMLRQHGLGGRYDDLLAWRLVHRYADRGQFQRAYLLHARKIARSVHMKAAICAVDVLSRLFGGPRMLRLYLGLRRLVGRPVTRSRFSIAASHDEPA